VHVPEITDLADRIVGHYEKHAVAWDADRRNSGWNDQRWHDRFVEALPKFSRVLDLGCGGGIPVARNLAAHAVRVTGVDSSPTMISLCRSRLPQHEWMVADMRSLSLKRSFNGVLAWDSFFHLKPDDQHLMFAVFAAHAEKTTMLMFNTGPAFGEGAGSYRGDPLYHASLDSDEYGRLLAANGFEIVDHVVEDPKAGGRTVWLARRNRS
jgi:predicted TPR repeat methyltransferase